MLKDCFGTGVKDNDKFRECTKCPYEIQCANVSLISHDMPYTIGSSLGILLSVIVVIIGTLIIKITPAGASLIILSSSIYLAGCTLSMQEENRMRREEVELLKNEAEKLQED